MSSELDLGSPECVQEVLVLREGLKKGAAIKHLHQKRLSTQKMSLCVSSVLKLVSDQSKQHFHSNHKSSKHAKWIQTKMIPKAKQAPPTRKFTRSSVFVP